MEQRGFIHHSRLLSQGYYHEHQLEEYGYIHRNDLESKGYFKINKMQQMGYHHKSEVRKKLLNAEVITAARGKANPAESYCYVGDHILKNSIELCSDSNTEDLEKLFHGSMATWSKTIKKSMAQKNIEIQNSKQHFDERHQQQPHRDEPRSPSRNSRYGNATDDSRRTYSSHHKSSSSSSRTYSSRRSDKSSSSKYDYDSDYGKKRYQSKNK